MPIDYHGTLTVLAGTGTPTPIALWICNPFGGGCGWGDGHGFLDGVVPRPELGIRLSSDVYAAELTVDYTAAANVIDILDSHQAKFASASLDHDAVVWLEDDTTGDARVHAVSQGNPIRNLGVVFELEGTTPLDPANVNVFVNGAWDQNGNSVSGVSATIVGIY